MPDHVRGAVSLFTDDGCHSLPRPRLEHYMHSCGSLLDVTPSRSSLQSTNWTRLVQFTPNLRISDCLQARTSAVLGGDHSILGILNRLGSLGFFLSARICRVLVGGRFLMSEVPLYSERPEVALFCGRTEVIRNRGHAPPLGWSYAFMSSPAVRL